METENRHKGGCVLSVNSSTAKTQGLDADITLALFKRKRAGLHILVIEKILKSVL